MEGDIMKIKSKYYDYEPIGKRIKKLRQEKNMTQECLAENFFFFIDFPAEVHLLFQSVHFPLLR